MGKTGSTTIGIATYSQLILVSQGSQSSPSRLSKVRRSTPSQDISQVGPPKPYNSAHIEYISEVGAPTPNSYYIAISILESRMTTKSRVGAAAAYSWFNNVKHQSHVQVSMGKGPGQSRNTLSQTWWCDKRTTVLVSTISISNHTPTPIVVATPPKKSPSKGGASASYGHDDHSGHDGHSSIKRLIVIQCQMVYSVQDISQVGTLTPHDYDAIL